MNTLYKKHIKISLFILIAISFTNCEKEALQSLPDRDWELVWSDEFTGEEGTLPDPSKWSYDIGNGDNGWGNQELQYYTNRAQNISLDGNGNLQITSIRENYQGYSFTSARIKTQNLFTQTYGKIEARIKLPFGPGIWPAFWMLGADIESVGWPNCGEIDIMELRGNQPHIIHGSLHGPGYSAGNAITKAFGLQDSRFDMNFHQFAIEWDKDKIDFFVDNYLYNRVTREDIPHTWVYDKPFFIIFNIAVGGNFVGFPTTDTQFPQKMLIDYIRVYKTK